MNLWRSVRSSYPATTLIATLVASLVAIIVSVQALFFIRQVTQGNEAVSNIANFAYVIGSFMMLLWGIFVIIASVVIAYNGMLDCRDKRKNEQDNADA